MPETWPLGERWWLDVRELGSAGRQVVIHATDEERAALAGALGVVACQRLELSVEATSQARASVHVAGRVVADVVQACVVSLEPVAQHIDVEVDVEFARPTHSDAGAMEVELDIDHDLPEPIVDGRIDLGRLAYEIVGVELEPYPRAGDADDGWTGSARAGDDDQGPFADLKVLQSKS